MKVQQHLHLDGIVTLMQTDPWTQTAVYYL